MKFIVKPNTSSRESTRIVLQAVCRSSLAALAIWLSASTAVAQSSIPRSQPAQQPVAPMESMAWEGEPFGAGRISIDLGQVPIDQIPRVLINEADGRIFYPAITMRELPVPPAVAPAPAPSPNRRIGRGALVQRLRQAIATARDQMQHPVAMDIDFLFVGSQPLQVQVRGAVEFSFELPVQPRQPDDVAVVARTQQWYEAFTSAAKHDINAGDYPPVFQTFLAETMARRLQVQPIDLRTEKERRATDPLAKPLSTLELLSNTESLRDAIFRETLRSPPRIVGETNVPIPQPPQWLPVDVADTPDTLPIETIAHSVPPECFYLRFGKFSNYLWFKELSAGKGAGLAQMVSVRGSDSNANAKIEKMLNTKTTLIARLFGDAIIRDMAIIGTDLYMQDGASMGVLFEASNIGQLKSSMDSERAQAAKLMESQGVQLDTLEVAGRQVTLLSNRDHSIRSFRAVDGDYLFLTTSQTLVERFYAIRDGEASLAKTREFRYARLLMPLQNEYELFGYFSSKFLQNLVSPQYNIELRRRYATKAKLASVEMATLMAEAEGIPHSDIESLIQANLLPAWFNDSPDGSKIVRQGDLWLDSRRGGLGALLPILDVPLLDCAPGEASKYIQDAAFYTSQWRSTEPMLVGVRRFESELGKQVDRIAIEAYVTPFNSEKLGAFGKYLAPPVEAIIATPPDDIVSVQAHMAGQNLLGAHAPDNVLFAGLKDAPPPPMLTEDPKLLEVWRAVRNTPFYLGAWPLPGYLDQLPLGLGGSRPDVYGFSRALIGMWRWQGNGFSVISFDRGILENAISYLQPTTAPDPAQVRCQVKDLENSQLAPWVNDFWYRRSFAACRGNLRLLDAMQQQFHLSPDESLVKSQRLLDTMLVCPLGGSYELDNNQFWTCTELRNTQQFSTSAGIMQVNLDSLIAPPDFKAEWLGWLRGLQAHVTQSPEGLTLIATFDVEKFPVVADAKSDDVKLPALNFDLFSLPSQLFGGKKAENETPKKEQREF